MGASVLLAFILVAGASVLSTLASSRRFRPLDVHPCQGRVRSPDVQRRHGRSVLLMFVLVMMGASVLLIFILVIKGRVHPLDVIRIMGESVPSTFSFVPTPGGIS